MELPHLTPTLQDLACPDPSPFMAPEAPGLQLVTVRPGPVLHVWQGGAEVAAVPLTPSAALRLAADLLAALAPASLAHPAAP